MNIQCPSGMCSVFCLTQRQEGHKACRGKVGQTFLSAAFPHSRRQECLRHLHLGIRVLLCVVALAGVAVAEEAAEMKEELVPIKFESAMPWMGSYPMVIGNPPNLEPPREGKPYPPILVPKGCDQLLSKGCKVTSSTPPIKGELSALTDGNKKDCLQDDEYRRWCVRLVLSPGLQWVQIDLGEQKEIYAVCIWHCSGPVNAYRDVIAQISDDPDFIDGAVTIFNNDHDNSAGLGVGKDFEYLALPDGRPIPANGTKGRYVRCYSNGNYAERFDNGNTYIQVEVFGRK